MAGQVNPLAQVAYQVAKGVRKNAAVIQYRHKYNDLLTGIVDDIMFERDIYLRDPDNAADWLVSQGAYIAGDLRAYIPYLCLSKTREVLTSDPVVKSSNGDLTLDDIRPWRETTGGIVCGTDAVLWNGDCYSIIRIEPVNFWHSLPSQYRVTLRRVGSD